MAKETLNTTEVMTGKDAKLFVECGGVNVFLAELETFSVMMNVNTTEKQPVGDILVHRIPTGVSFDLTFTEMVIRDDVVMEPLLAEIKKGKIPVYNFQGATEKPDGQEQRLSFNNAVPNGSFGILSATPGEVISREQSYALNSIPEYVKSIASTYLKKSA